jgi:HK97 family phage major capsid protein
VKTNPNELRAHAAELIEQAQKLKETVEAEGRAYTDEESESFDALINQIEAEQNEAKRLEAEEDRQNRLTAAENIANTSLGRTFPITDPPANLDSNSPGVPAIPVDHEEEGRRGFNHFGDFASAVYQANPNVGAGGAVDERLRTLAAATGMSQGVGSDGGFLVPPTFSQIIWDGLNAAPDSLLARTDQYTVDGESLTFPANAETDRATGSRYGGIRGYWLAEADQITSSKPKFRQMKLEPQELAVLVYVTDKLLRNSGALESYLTRGSVDEINFLVGDSIINGDGAGKPLGVMNSGCLVTVAKETSQAADTFQQTNVAKMWARLHARARANAIWTINQDVDPQLLEMVTKVPNIGSTDFVGGFTSLLYNPANDTLMGRPVVRTEYNATIGDLGDVIVGDFGAYATGLQGGIRSAASIHLRFDYAETAFRFMFAVDGQTWLNSALTPFKGTNTLSTFVTLAART